LLGQVPVPKAHDGQAGFSASLYFKRLIAIFFIMPGQLRIVRIPMQKLKADELLEEPAEN
jgi:hypothetical protein